MGDLRKRERGMGDLRKRERGMGDLRKRESVEREKERKRV